MKISITKSFMISVALFCGIFITNVFASGKCQDCYGGLTGYKDCKIAGLDGIIDGLWKAYVCTNANRWIWKCPPGEYALVTPHAETISCSGNFLFGADVDTR